MKNKKGDVPVTILVIGVFVVCSLALLTFLNSNIQTRKSFVGVDLMENINLQIEENNFLGKNFEELFLEKKVKKGIWFFQREVLLFSVKYSVP